MNLHHVLAASLLFTALACSVAPSPRDAAEGFAAVAPAPSLVAEAGFVDVPAEKAGSTSAARMFYSFIPADTDAESRPLVVMFNGGPGWATTVGLFTWGTGPYTFDVHAAPGTPPVKNSASWTRFANLLYIDQRATGFSYEFATGGPPGCNATPDAVFADAADFVRVLLSFFDAHPSLSSAAVIIAGESYGGERATAMLDILLRYSTTAPRLADDLGPAIEAHYKSIFPTAPTPISEQLAATQFGRVVLLEPFVGGGAQWSIQAAMSTSDPDFKAVLAIPPAMYDMLVPPDSALLAVALPAIADPDASRTLFGVDLGTVGDLLPAARTGVWRFPDVSLVGAPIVATNQAFTTRFGALSPNDSYYDVYVYECHGDLFSGPGTELEFAKNLASVKTFLTRAALDNTIWSPAIVEMMKSNFTDPMGNPVDVTVDDAPRSGVARPGWIRVGTNPEIRYPLYANSGHEITTTQPADLADDVEAWLSE